jgi:apolipoprotein N-acyltransferase
MLKTAKQKSNRRIGAPTGSPSSDLGRVDKPEAAPERQPIVSTTLVAGLAGSLMLWAAFPPLDLPALAWIAPAPWLWLVRWPRLPGWRPYVVLWVCGFVHWLLMLEGIRLAHPALYAGWIALAAYLGVYLPVFVGLTRVGVHRRGVSVVVAAPIVWVGLELARGYLITGFSMGLLAHTQAEFPRLIQISDLAGGYTLSFAIMLVAACVARMIPLNLPTPDSRPSTPITWWSSAVVATAIAGTLLYGSWRLSEKPPGAGGPMAHAALIQGSLDTVFEISQERVQETFDHYRRLTAQAINEHPNLDLVVWPESMFAVPETIVEEPMSAPPQAQISSDEWRARVAAVQDDFRTLLAGETARANARTDSDHAGTMLLVGTTSIIYGSSPRVYNTALLADRAGNVAGRYYKTHPVMFGEYIPFGDLLPWIYRLTPMSGGLSIGDGPKVFEIAGLKMSPSVCFESTVPHLIRGQIAELKRRGTPADVLINVTNDGWFWGTGMLDLHFRCGVFRAVENRKPLLVVANTGISTWVDGSGVIRERGPRRQPRVLVAEVQTDGRTSPYQTLGDWFAWLCAGGCLGLAAIGLCQPRVT